MKKLILIFCLTIVFISCSKKNKLEEAEVMYKNALKHKSFKQLEKATLIILKALNDGIEANDKEARLLLDKIDSTKYSWHNDKVEIINEKKDEELRKLEAEEVRLNLLNKAIEDSLKLLDTKYPNIIGRWVLKETNYLSTLNGIVRIYKKRGVFYRSMVFDKDGSESVLKLKKLSNKRYDVIGKSDYIIINNEGNLEFWDKQGYFLTCKSGISE
tara:strand:+ start:491 stop:1132 length:642 start_codon:yes stop_codon:yes gene_type:complete